MKQAFHKYNWQGKTTLLGTQLLNSPSNRLGTKFITHLKVIAGTMLSRKRVDIRLWVAAKKGIDKRFPGGPTLKGITLSREQYLHFRSIIVPRVDEYFKLTEGEIEHHIDSYWTLNKLGDLLESHEENQSIGT